MPKLSSTKLAARRQHILRAAAICFDRQGFHRTTIADIRREARASTGAIYTYFPNKEAIIRALLQDAQTHRRGELAKAAEQPEAIASEAQLLLEWISKVFTKDGNHVARVDVNLWAEALRDRAVGKLARTALSEATATVAAVVAAQLTHAPRDLARFDVNDVAAVMVGMFLGLEVQTAVGIKLNAEGIGRVLARLFSVAHLAQPAQTSRRTPAGRTRAKRSAKSQYA